MEIAAIISLHQFAPIAVGPRVGEVVRGSIGSPTCVRIFRIVSGWLMKLINGMSPPRIGHASEDCPPDRASSSAQAIREVL